MLVMIIRDGEYREFPVDVTVKMYGCKPFRELGERARKALNRIDRVPDIKGTLATNEETGENWIEACLWRYTSGAEGGTEYLWCDGGWHCGTEDEESDEPDMDYKDKAPVSSDCTRRFKGYFNSSIEILEAYYLSRRKEKKISAFQYFKIGFILAVENRLQGRRYV